MNAPPARMISRATPTRCGAPASPARIWRRAIKILALQIFHADGALVGIQQDTCREGVEFDVQPMLAHGRQDPFPRAAPPSRAGRQRNLAKALGEPALQAGVVGIAFADDETRQPCKGYPDGVQPGGERTRRGRPKVRQDRSAHHAHEGSIAERFPRHGDFSLEPSLPAVPGWIEAIPRQPREETPKRTVPAILEAAEITPHMPRAPG